MSTPGGYVVYPIARIPDDLLDDAYTFIHDKVPEWTPNPNNLDVWILQVEASQAADFLTLAQDVPDSIFMYYGNSIMVIPPLSASSAQVDSTWTMVDAAGYTIPSGTQVSIRDDSGVEHAFETGADVIVPAGQTKTADGAVTLTSVETGALLTGLGGVGYVASMIDTINYIASVVLTEQSSGGQDAELVSEYLARLSRKMQRLSTRPILASDFSLAAFDVPGVWRSLALDGYNSADNSYNNERYLGIAAVDELGQPVSAQIKTDLQTYLDSQRETNFVVNVFDPTVTHIDVTYNVKCLTGYLPAVVKSNCDAQLGNYFNPATWGQDPAIIEATSQSQTWVVTNKAIYNKLIQELASTQGVDYVIDATFAISGQALAKVDIALPGAAALAAKGTFNGTATP